MFLPYGGVGCGKHLKQLILAQGLLMVQRLRVDKALELKVSFCSYLLNFFLLFDLFISFLDDKEDLLSAIFVDKFEVEHLLGEHLGHVLHQALEEFGARETHIDAQLVTRVLL